MTTIKAAVIALGLVASAVSAGTPTFECRISNHGHTYGVYGTNRSNSNLVCEVRCDLVRSTQAIEPVKCTAHLLHGEIDKYICGNTEPDPWIRANGVAHSCAVNAPGVRAARRP